MCQEVTYLSLFEFSHYETGVMTHSILAKKKDSDIVRSDMLSNYRDLTYVYKSVVCCRTVKSCHFGYCHR